jgi:hypothetical protein
MIHTRDDRKLKDTHPQTIVRELNRLNDRIKRLESAGDALYEAWLGYGFTKDNHLTAWLKAKEAK